MVKPVDIQTSLTAERLRSLLIYEPDTGIFRWHIPRKRCVVGEIAGCLRQNGSWQIRLDGHLYRAHRLAWLYMTGKWPVDEIDHKNRISSDNRWDNLREATRLQNQVNVVLSNSTGYSNVDRVGGRYRAKARFNGKTRHLGMADTAREAHAIAVEARREIHGDFVVSQLGN